MYKIGVIGSGHRMTPLVRRLLEFDDFYLGAVCDPDETVKEKYADLEGVEYFTDSREMMEKAKPDCVMIGTRCSLHTPLAMIAGAYRVPIFLEKPVSIDREQLEELKTLLPMSDQVVVSFPLRNCPLVNGVREILQSGKLGEISQVQAYNNVYYARGYYHGWYRDEQETGGLFLQKTTHDFDYLNSLLPGLTPVTLAAMESKLIFKGNETEKLLCKDCPKKITCPESARNIYTYNEAKFDPDLNEFYCCYATDTGNHDSATCMVQYDNGLHLTYVQNFVARKSAGKRGARFIGYLGTLEFDFNTGTIDVIYHNQNRTEHHKYEKTPGHSGGDAVLIQNFADVVRGVDVSHATLAQGIESAHLCLCAKESAQTHTFINC